MNAKFFKNVYYRESGAIVSTLTKGGTYPDYTFNGFTKLPGSVDAATMIPEPAVETPADGAATNRVDAEKVPVEITVSDLTSGEIATLRGLINEKLDIVFIDPDQPSVAFAAFGVRVYVKPDISAGAAPKLVISGARSYGMGVATLPLQFITVS